MNRTITHYREGLATLKLVKSFFRPDSIISRDLSVLIACKQTYENQGSSEKLRWLDLISGSGIRSLRWGLESHPLTKSTGIKFPIIEIWANIADIENTI